MSNTAKALLAAVILAAFFATAFCVSDAVFGGTTQSCARVDLHKVATGDACYLWDGTHIFFTVVEP